VSGRIAESEHRVTPLELFFDLVFVFGFTQVTTLLRVRSRAARSGCAVVGVAEVCVRLGLRHVSETRPL